MKPCCNLNSVRPAAALCCLLALALFGCKPGQQTAAKLAKEIDAKLAAIRQAGEPVTLAEFDAWYAEPPAGENAAPLYLEAFAALAVTDPKAPGFVEKNQKALDLLHQAAGRTQCRFPADLKAGYKTLLPHLQKAKLSAQLLQQEAILNAGKGRTDLAAQSLLAGLRLARSLEPEPLLISQLVRLSAEELMVAGLEDSLSRKAFAVSELMQLQGALADAENGAAAALARAFAGERCSIASLFLGTPQAATEALSGANEAVSAAALENYLKSETNRADFAFCLDQISNLLASVREPYPQPLAAAEQWSIHIDEAKSKGYLIASSLLPQVAKPIERQAVVTAHLRVAQATLALERYRLAHAAACPDTLAALVPQCLQAIPSDPFDSNPVRYKKTGPKGYVVYSVGPDRQDNGGQPPKAGSSPTANADVTFCVRR